MNIRSVVSAVTAAAVLALGACSSTPPPPNWQLNAQGSAERAVDAWLSGNSRISDIERHLDQVLPLYAKAIGRTVDTLPPDPSL